MHPAQTQRRPADESGHQAKTLEKMLWLLDLLQRVARDRDLVDRPVLKGGTALYHLHLGPDRISADPDFNHVGTLDHAAIEAERPGVDAAANRIDAIDRNASDAKFILRTVIGGCSWPASPSGTWTRG